MAVERLPVVILPSGRVPGRVLLVLPILEARRRRNRDEIAKKGSRLEGFGMCVKYRPKGGIRGDLGGPGAPRRGLEGGRATRAPGALVAPLRLSFGFLEVSGMLIFYIYFQYLFSPSHFDEDDKSLTNIYFVVRNPSWSGLVSRHSPLYHDTFEGGLQLGIQIEGLSGEMEDRATQPCESTHSLVFYLPLPSPN